MSVQISLFGDGGYAIGVKLAHVLGDAQSLMTFVHMWAAKSRDLHSDTFSPSLFDSPFFDPKRPDDHASGDINRSDIDPHLAAVARALPLPRYDCWEAAGSDFHPSLLKRSKELCLHRHSLRISSYHQQIRLLGPHGTFQDQLATPISILVEIC